VPLRLMTLHFSQIFLTDARTFMTDASRDADFERRKSPPLLPAGTAAGDPCSPC
jgi:hypothetical protein